MSGLKRFWIGGSGALLPLLITLIGADLAVLIDQHEQLSSGMIIGAGIRYACLFILGGFVAALHSDERKPIKLVQLGIAAPALITSYISVGPVSPNDSLAFDIPAIIGSAHASDSIVQRDGEIVVASGFFNDVFKGWSRPLDRTVKEKQRSVATAPAKPKPAAAKPAASDAEKKKQVLLKQKMKIEQELKRLEKRSN